MQIGLPFEQTVVDEPLEIHFVRMRQARRYVMRVRPDGALRVTIPRGGSQAEARRFAARHIDWARRQRTRVLSTQLYELVESLHWDEAQAISGALVVFAFLTLASILLIERTAGRSRERDGPG